MIKPIITWMEHKARIILSTFIISSILFTHKAKADAISDITTIIANLTCETTEIGNMIHGEFGHTCIPMPFSTLAMAMILNPLAPLYLAGITTMNINNDKLFLNSCSRANRAIPFNTNLNPQGPKIPFAFCNDVLLRLILVEAAATAAINATAAVVTGSNVWDAIINALTLNPNDYNLGPNFDSISSAKAGYPVGYGSRGEAWAMAGMMPIPINVVQDNDRICVATVGITGWLSMGCKYIAEPVVQSQYADFMNDSAPTNSYTQCSGMGSCYTDANTNSHVMLPISGPLIGCIRAMINQFLNSPTVCSANGNQTHLSSTFFQFQRNMQRTITALLTIYVIFFGFKLALGASEIKQGDIIMFFVKFILVLYFAIGTNMTSPARPNGQEGFDGMTKWVFPIILGGSNELASWIMNASPSGLCQFNTNTASQAKSKSPAALNIVVQSLNNTPAIDKLSTQTNAQSSLSPLAPSSNSNLVSLGRTSTQLSISSNTVTNFNYTDNYKWLALWDALDCRIAHYIGLDSIGDATSMANINDTTKSDAFNFSIPPYFFLLIPAIITANVPMAMLAIAYPIMIISVAAYMINAFIVCLISTTILGVLAPIFIPLSLFNVTKGYFDSWAKLLLSFTLQPMVVATFMITLFTIYDAGFYGTCQYSKFNIPQVYAGGETINKTVFVINSDPSAYVLNTANGIDDWKSCQRSLGYMINSVFAVSGNTASFATSIGSSVSFGQSYASLSAKYPILSAVTDEVGLFFTSPKLAFQAIKDFIMSLLTACFCLYVMYQMSSQISQFAVDMTEGISIGNMAIKPRAIMSKVQAGAQKLEDKLNERKVKPKEEDQKDKTKADDSASSDKGSKAQDSSSAGSNDSDSDVPQNSADPKE